MSDDVTRNDAGSGPEAGPPEKEKPSPSPRKLPRGLLRRAGAVALGLVLVYLVVYQGIWRWGLCRVYVGPGETLVLNAKFGEANPNPDEMRVVPEGYQGIREKVYGEGRHFFNPFTYDRMTDTGVQVIEPDTVGLVESKSGTSLPPGEFLADKGQKGIMRRVLTPGRWRLNPVAYEVTPIPSTVIEPGFVGCVTALSGRTPAGAAAAAQKPGDEEASHLAEPGERGIQKKVLPPGIYFINPREYKVDVVEVGYRQISFRGVKFPSKDGFPIQLDVSVVWGLEPDNVPHIINNYGNISDVVDKVIYPQVESICRIEGSKYGAKEFIEGKTRERFQNEFWNLLRIVCSRKRITVQQGLVRDISVPKEVRTPIQQGKIAAEEKLTKEEQKTTQTVKNDLEELKADVRKGVREVEAETSKEVAEVSAEGEKKVAQINAETQVQVAAIRFQAAQLEAAKDRMLGKAQAEVEEMKKKAEADELAQAILALGSPDDYARFIFAQNLPDDIRIFLRYSGEGTFWTDLPSSAKDWEKLAAMRILEAGKKKKNKK